MSSAGASWPFSTISIGVAAKLHIADRSDLPVEWPFWPSLRQSKQVLRNSLWITQQTRWFHQRNAFKVQEAEVAVSGERLGYATGSEFTYFRKLLRFIFSTIFAGVRNIFQKIITLSFLNTTRV